MKQHSFGKRLAAVFLAAFVVATLIPLGTIGDRAYASAFSLNEYEDGKTIDGMGASVIKAPSALADLNAAWKGSYVWYGKYDGNPVKYRVLDPHTTKFNEKIGYAPPTIVGGPTMFLECDSILYKAPYYASGSAPADTRMNDRWTKSDINAGLNGSAFLTKGNGFTAAERAAITKSYLDDHPYEDGIIVNGFAGRMTAYLSGEKIFLMDIEDCGERMYGYSPEKIYIQGLAARNKTFGDDGVQRWWLRSFIWAYDGSGGDVNTAGRIVEAKYDEEIGVSPVFNIDLSSVIFTSCIRGTCGKDGAEYKLTIKDDDIRLALRDGVVSYFAGDRIRVNYDLSGKNAKNCTRMSILILDREYTPGNSNDARIYYYFRPDLAPNVLYGSDLTQNTMVSFELPEGFTKEGWNDGFYVYLLAEQEGDYFGSDYASEPVLIPAPAELTILEQPQSVTAEAYSIANFSVRAAGEGDLTYQWQSRKDASSSWTNSGQSGSKTETLSVNVVPGLEGWQFRCIVRNTNGKQVISNTVKLSVLPYINRQPGHPHVNAGETADFYCSAIGKAPLTYQWQSRKNSNASWTNSGQTGAKTNHLSVAAIAGLDGWQFRCIVTDGNGRSKSSTVATLSVSPFAITSQPKDTTVAVGNTAKFTVAAFGQGTVTYQWQSRKDSSYSWTNSGQSGAKTATLSVAAIAGLHGWQFRCIVKDSKGHEEISKVVILLIKPKITTQPKNTTVTAGAKATFTVAADGKAPLRYQWQSRKNASSEWTNSGQSGAKTAKLTVNALAGLNGWQFRCVVIDANGQINVTNTVTLTVK